jgi:hypothetical protein
LPASRNSGVNLASTIRNHDSRTFPPYFSIRLLTVTIENHILYDRMWPLGGQRYISGYGCRRDVPASCDIHRNPRLQAAKLRRSRRTWSP